LHHEWESTQDGTEPIFIAEELNHSIHVLGEHPKDDPLKPELTSMMAQVVGICRPIIEGGLRRS
jgi:hypothetical protein